jgi:hypothetical protein
MSSNIGRLDGNLLIPHPHTVNEVALTLERLLLHVRATPSTCALRFDPFCDGADLLAHSWSLKWVRPYFRQIDVDADAKGVCADIY